MEGPGASKYSPAITPPRPGRRSDLPALLVLLALAGAVHVWLIRHTEVTARDGVGFMRYAWQLQTQDWRHVLRENPHPPFYPLTVLAVSYPVRLLAPGDVRSAMQLSAQLTSILAGMLLILPMYFLGRDLFNRRVGFWSALLFQCFPASARVLSDALSESVFLLLAATTFLLALRAFRRYRWPYFAGIGLCGGLAYLTRPEGTLLVAATGLVLAARQLWPAERQAWRPVCACSLGLLVPALAVGLPYAVLIGHVTNKTTGQKMLETASATPDEVRPAVGPAVLASTLAVWGPGSKDFGFWGHQLWCLSSVCREVARGFHYIAWLPALLGLYWYRGRIRSTPGVWVALLVPLLHALVLWRVAFVMGYVAERHGLLIVMAGLPWSLAGVQGLAGITSRWLAEARGHAYPRLLTNPATLGGLLLGALAVSGLPKTLEPMHTNRAGYHAAGLWLAAHAGPDDQIMDPFCWAEFYAGQVFRRPSYNYDMSRPPRYVVLGGSKNEHERLPLIPYANEFARRGEVVYHWAPSKARQKAEEVVVYRLP